MSMLDENSCSFLKKELSPKVLLPLRLPTDCKMAYLRSRLQSGSRGARDVAT